jgi:hypothetical protein
MAKPTIPAPLKTEETFTPPPPPIVIKSISDEVEEFISGYKIASAYPKELGDIRDSLNQRWTDLSPADRSKEKETLAEILEARNLAAKQHNNVIAREREVRRYEFGQITDLEGAMRQLSYQEQLKRGVDGPKPTFLSQIKTLLSDAVTNSDRQIQIEFLKTSEDPVTHIDPPSPKYRSLVLDARTQTQDSLDAANKQFFTLVNEGREATDQEISQTKKYGRAKSFLSRSAESAVSPLIGLTKYLGRGMISNSEVADDSRYEKYVETRNALLTGLRNRLGTKSPEIRQLIDQFEQVCGNPNLDEQQLLRIQHQLINEIGKLENIDEKQLQKVHERVNELNSRMLNGYTDESGKHVKGLKEHMADEDSAWLYIAFQMALLMTPLAGFSFLGMAGGMIGPLFDPNLTFGKSVGAVIANIPVVGQLFHLMKIDYAIAFLLDNCPIVENITDVLGEVTNNVFTQGAFSFLAPAATTQLAGLALAGAYYGYVLDPKLSERDKDGNFLHSKSDTRKEFVESQNKETEDGIRKAINDQESEKERKDTINQSRQNLAAKSHQLELEALTKKINETHKANPQHLAEIFSGLPVGASPQEMVAAVTQNPLLLSKAGERMIAYDHFEKDIEKFKAGKAQIPQIVRNHHQKTLENLGSNLHQRLDLARFILLHDQDTLEKVFGGLELTKHRTTNLADYAKEDKKLASPKLPSLLEMSENQNLIEIALEKIPAATGQKYGSASPKEKRDLLIKFISESSDKDFVILQKLPLTLQETEVGSISDFKQKQSFNYPSELLQSLALTRPEIVRECIERMSEYLTPKKSVEPSTAKNVSGKNPSHNLPGQTRPGVSITA